MVIHAALLGQAQLQGDPPPVLLVQLEPPLP